MEESVEITAATGIAPTSGVETRAGGSISTGSVLNGGPLYISVVRIDQTGESGGDYYPYTQENEWDGTGQAPRDAKLIKHNQELRMNFIDAEFFLPAERTHNNTKLIGWYPPVKVRGSLWRVDENRNVPNATVTFTVDGETDILMSNLVEGNVHNKYNGERNTLVFAHLLTRFCVRVFTRDAATVPEWGSVKNISIRGKGQSCVVSLPGVDATTSTIPNNIRFTGTDHVNLSSLVQATIPVITGETNVNGFLIGTTLVGTVMVAPEATSITLDVVNENLSGEVRVPAPPGGFIAGHSYTLTLEYSRKEILLSDVSINEWVAGVGENLTIGD